MFWGATYSTRNELDRLLEEGEDGEPVTLERLFAESSFSSEIRSNIRLQEYLASPIHLSKVIKYAFLEPSQEMIFDHNITSNEDVQWGVEIPSTVSVARAAFVSCEILSVNSCSITRAILREESYIDEIILTPLSRPEGLSSLVIERLFKFVEKLFSRNREELGSYLKKKWSQLLLVLIPRFENRNIAELTLYFWMSSDPLQDIFCKGFEDNLHAQEFIKKLLEYLCSSSETEEQEIAYQFILDLINFPLASPTEHHPAASFVYILMNPTVVRKLVQHLCHPNSSQTKRLYIIHILSQVLQWSPSQDFGAGEISRQKFIIALSENIEDITKLLSCPSIIPDAIENSTGTFVPLGAVRLQLGDLFTQLIKVGFYYQMGSYPNLDFEIFEKMRNTISDKPLALPEEFPQSPFISPELIDAIDSNDESSDEAQSTVTDNGKLSSPDDSQISSAFEPPKSLNEDDSSKLWSFHLNPFLLDISDLETLHVQALDSQSISDLICESIRKHNILKWFIDTFFEYPWHNLFHNTVYNSIYYLLHWPLNLPTMVIKDYNLPLTQGQSLLSELFTHHQFVLKMTNNLIPNNSQISKRSSVGYSEHLIALGDEIVSLVSRLRSPEDPVSDSLLIPILSALEGQGWNDFLECQQKLRLDENSTSSSFFGKFQVDKLLEIMEARRLEQEGFYSYNSTNLYEDELYDENEVDLSDGYNYECSSDEEIYSPGDDNVDDQISYLMKVSEIDDNYDSVSWQNDFSQDDAQELSGSYAQHSNYDELSGLPRSYSCDNFLNFGEGTWLNSKPKEGSQDHAGNVTRASESIVESNEKSKRELESALPEDTLETNSL